MGVDPSLTGRKDHRLTTGVKLELHALVLRPVSGDLDRNFPPMVRPRRAKRRSLSGGLEGLFHRFFKRGFRQSRGGPYLKRYMFWVVQTMDEERRAQIDV